MDALLYSSVIALWLVVIVILLLVLRIVRWARGLEEREIQSAKQEGAPELAIGYPAPDFRARALSGEYVGLSDYLGRSVVFLFLSPNCATCTSELPDLVRLGKVARQRAGVEFVLVSDVRATVTHEWVGRIQANSDSPIDLQVMIAPPGSTTFLFAYNPRGLFPYYCLVDERGIVRARGPLGMGEWIRLRSEWEGVRTGVYASRRYR